VTTRPFTGRDRTLAAFGALALLAAILVPSAAAPASAATCELVPTTVGAVTSFQVASGADLAKVGVGACGLDANYLQTASFTLIAPAEGSSNHTPIGTTDTPFTGVYDGGGWTITGLTIVTEDRYAGLFGVVGAAGTLMRVALVDVDVTGARSLGGLVGRNGGAISLSSVTGSVTSSGADVGGLVGENTSTGTIADSFSTATVTGDTSSQIGGLVGENGGMITDSHATGAVFAKASRLGGLVGENTGDGRIAGSFATGPVTGDGDGEPFEVTGIGGLVGRNVRGDIRTSFATGDVLGRNAVWVGGLVGSSTGLVFLSFATGDVTATNGGVGGLVGEAGGSTGHIENSYATGDVTGGRLNDGAGGVQGDYRVGGLVGYSDSSVINSYALGAVTGTQATGRLIGEYAAVSPVELMDSTALAVGEMPLVGELSGEVVNSALRTSAQLKAIATFDSLFWSIVDGWAEFAPPPANPARVWGICDGVNDGYPFLLWQYGTDPCGDSDGDDNGDASTPATLAGKAAVLTPGTGDTAETAITYALSFNCPDMIGGISDQFVLVPDAVVGKFYRITITYTDCVGTDGGISSTLYRDVSFEEQTATNARQRADRKRR
jgi:hypothetical protein